MKKKNERERWNDGENNKEEAFLFFSFWNVCSDQPFDAMKKTSKEMLN